MVAVEGVMLSCRGVSMGGRAFNVVTGSAVVAVPDSGLGVRG